MKLTIGKSKPPKQSSRAAQPLSFNYSENPPTPPKQIGLIRHYCLQNSKLKPIVGRPTGLLRWLRFPYGENPHLLGDGERVLMRWFVWAARIAAAWNQPVFVHIFLSPTFCGTTKLAPCHKKPRGAIPFDKAISATTKNQWVHFFIDDARFECLWENPKTYLELLKSFDGIIATDFSLYLNMPLSFQVWNTYRNRALTFWLQKQGVNVIPNVQWGLEHSYDFCFDGLPEGGIVAISTYGCIQDKAERFYFKKGLNRMIKRLKPRTIVVYSYLPDDIFLPYKKAGIEILHIPNWNETVRERGDV